MGAGGFRDEILGGTGGITLIREAAQSEGFVTGGFGWKLWRNGDAEFNNVTIRGSFSTGAPGTNRIVIEDDGSGNGFIFFYTGDPIETFPGIIQGAGEDGVISPYISLTPPDFGNGAPIVTITAPDPSQDGGVLIEAPYYSSGVKPTVVLSPDVTLRVQSPSDASLTSDNHGLQIGDTFGANLIADNNEIMARDNGGTATLNLQNEGGTTNIGGPIVCSDMRADDDDAAGNVVTLSAVFVADNVNGPNFTFPYPASGRVLVLFSADAVNSAAGFSNMSFRIRNTNAAGAIQFTGGAEETARKEGTGRVTIGTNAVVTGLPTSGTGFIEGLYLASSGTATFRNADITIVPVT